MYRAIILSAILLAGCESMNPKPKPVPFVAKPTLAQAPAWMVRQCPGLEQLPKKELSQEEVEQRWLADMKKYHECRTKHAAFARWIKQRDEAFLKGFKQ